MEVGQEGFAKGHKPNPYKGLFARAIRCPCGQGMEKAKKLCVRSEKNRDGPQDRDRIAQEGDERDMEQKGPRLVPRLM